MKELIEKIATKFETIKSDSELQTNIENKEIETRVHKASTFISKWMKKRCPLIAVRQQPLFI